MVRLLFYITEESTTHAVKRTLPPEICIPHLMPFSPGNPLLLQKRKPLVAALNANTDENFAMDHSASIHGNGMCFQRLAGRTQCAHCACNVLQYECPYAHHRAIGSSRCESHRSERCTTTYPTPK